MNGTWGIDPDDDGRQELNKAFNHLLDLDATGCALVLRIAEALGDYLEWEPSDPRPDHQLPSPRDGPAQQVRQPSGGV